MNWLFITNTYYLVQIKQQSKRLPTWFLTQCSFSYFQGIGEHQRFGQSFASGVTRPKFKVLQNRVGWPAYLGESLIKFTVFYPADNVLYYSLISCVGVGKGLCKPSQDVFSVLMCGGVWSTRKFTVRLVAGRVRINVNIELWFPTGKAPTLVWGRTLGLRKNYNRPTLDNFSDFFWTKCWRSFYWKQNNKII